MSTVQTERATLRSTLQAIVVCSWAIWSDYLNDRAERRAFERRFPLQPSQEHRTERIFAWLIWALVLTAAYSLAGLYLAERSFQP